MDAPSSETSLRGCLQRITAEGEKTAFLLSSGEEWTYQQTREAFLSAAIRFYHIDILARLAAGLAPTGEQVALIKSHLAENEKEIARVVSHYDA